MRHKMGLGAASSMLAIVLTGCGSSATAPVNKPPTFSSAAAVSVVENVTGSIYSANAIDPEGTALVYSIAGGVDAAAFSISGNQLSFVTAPNFDLPSDDDGNNIYLVRLNASDGQSSVSLDLQVTVANSREGISLQRVATGFVDPVAIVAIPGDNRMFVAERGGRLYLMDPRTGARTLFQTFTTTTTGDRGLQNIALARNYATSGQYFVSFSTVEGDLVIYNCSRSGQFGTPACYEQVASGVHSAEINNYGAFMGTGPDGKVYVATGDAGGLRDPNGSAQRDTSVLGKLLRIDDNPDPYSGAAIVLYQITTISKGFRNPRGGGFYNNMLLLGDRGESLKEEISLVPLAAPANYGWPFKEGTSTLSTPPVSVIDPVIEYPHIAGGGIVGGFVYRGSVASLRNMYVFADHSGPIFSVPASRIVAGSTLGPAAIERRTADFAPATGVLNDPVAFGEDNQGELYIVTTAGDIFLATVGT